MPGQFYNLDCMVGMSGFPDGHFDLAIIDPPYGINAPMMSMGSNHSRTGDGYPAVSAAEQIRKGRLNSGGGKLKNRLLNNANCNWDFEKPGPEYFEQIQRVSRHQIIWGGNYFNLPPTRGIICWDKMQPWENFSQWEMAWTSFDSPAAIFHFSNTGGRNDETKIHPTQKPVALYKWLLARYAKPGWRILDTHVGSASSLIACHQLGFEYVGYEIDTGYYKAALARLEAAKAQVSMLELLGETGE